jgi:chromosomal replication initiation ATPase DnaA
LSFYFTGVNEALRKAGEVWEKDRKERIPLAELIQKVASHLDLKAGSILSSSRKREVSEARAIISCLAVNDLGYNSSELAQALEISGVSAGQCIHRGQKMLDKNRTLRDRLIN